MPYLQSPKIIQAINQANHILLISHEKPDGDTLGSSLAVSHYLTDQNKNHKHFCADLAPSYFNFLPRIEKLITDYQQINLADHDLVITIDCGDLKRTKIEQELNRHRHHLIIINIDHHDSNNLFGHHNLVIPEASSTSEIIYNLFTYNKIGITKFMATSLLTGIITDTMNFTNAATNQDSLKIAADLLTKGAKIKQITDRITQTKNLGSLKLWGDALSRLEYNKQYNFAYTIITQKDIEKHQISMEEARDGLANFLSNLQDVDFILVLTEEADNKIKGNLRTTKDHIDVAKLAQIFGGGGHKKAAGFSLEGKIIPSPNGWLIQ